jgi:hypothetical protein
VIQLPFSTLKRRYLSGPEVSVKGDYFTKYPSSDFRNTLTGLSSGWDIKELNGSPGLASQEGLQNSNGIANAMGSTDKFSNMPMVIIDGMPTELQEAPLDAQDIESATLLKGILVYS